jgi:4-amino-4-deoxy-L-arabinose transferase-like glycosyltransferase
MAATPFLVMAVRLVVAHQDVLLAGDHAALDLGTLDATHGRAVLGPYSRFGFNHPGPAFFYLMAPVMLLTGRASWALYLGVQLLYAATAAALVMLVTIRAGRAAGAGAALVLLGYVAVVRPDVLAVPWNPLTIVPVMALLLVATAAVRGPGGLAMVAAAGTF